MPRRWRRLPTRSVDGSNRQFSERAASRRRTHSLTAAARWSRVVAHQAGVEERARERERERERKRKREREREGYLRVCVARGDGPERDGGARVEEPEARLHDVAAPVTSQSRGGASCICRVRGKKPYV
jgi:hypothetical protein